MNQAGVEVLVDRVCSVTAERPVRLVRVGIEAAGHYHRPLVSAGVLPAAWQVVVFNPAHVASQRQTVGRRTVKTDQIDLVAISDLLRAGHGNTQHELGVAGLDAAMLELGAWVAHHQRRVAVRTATKNQLLGQVDRAFPGLPGPGRMPVQRAGHQDRPAHPGPGLRPSTAGHDGPSRPAGPGRPSRCHGPDRGGRAAGGRCPSRHPDRSGPGRRTLLTADLALLAALDAQGSAAQQRLAALLTRTAFAVLTSTPG
jgi:transposase